VKVLSIVQQTDASAGVFADAASELVEWIPSKGPPPALDGVGAAMVFGGGMNVDQESAHPWLREEKQLIRELLDDGLPVLGVCLGAQLLAEVAGAARRCACRPFASARPAPGASSSTPRSRARTSTPGSTAGSRTTTRWQVASTLRRSGARVAGRSLPRRTWGAASRGVSLPKR
jgi:hypothetical protein